MADTDKLEALLSEILEAQRETNRLLDRLVQNSDELSSVLTDDPVSGVGGRALSVRVEVVNFPVE